MVSVGTMLQRLKRPPPQLYFVGSAIFHYLGPSFAVLLFARVPVAGVAWLRIVSAGVVFAVWRRPWRVLADSAPKTRWLIVALGAVFAVMNYSFYLAIAVVPLGTVAAIEFVGPLVLALAGNRTTRNVIAVILAAGGVWLLTDVRLEGSTAGFVWAFVNAVLFTAYVVLAHRLASTAGDASPIDRLAASMLVASVAITPLGLASALPALTDLVALGAGIGVRYQFIGHPVRVRPARDATPATRDLRAVRRAATRDRRRRRDRRAATVPDARRGRRCWPGHTRRRHPPGTTAARIVGRAGRRRRRI